MEGMGWGGNPAGQDDSGTPLGLHRRGWSARRQLGGPLAGGTLAQPVCYLVPSTGGAVFSGFFLGGGVLAGKLGFRSRRKGSRQVKQELSPRPLVDNVISAGFSGAGWVGDGQAVVP